MAWRFFCRANDPHAIERNTLPPGSDQRPDGETLTAREPVHRFPRMILHQPATLWPSSSHGPFRIRRMRPGTGLGRPDGDTGLGPLGTVDRASLSPGLTVPMHEHRDDEILSYLRSGQMHHSDSSGAAQMLDATTLMLMLSLIHI